MSTSRYMTIATADADGTPWVTPVWFAPDGHDGLLWVSDPRARHSRNIEARSRVAIVIYDSRVAPADAQGLYLTADAAQVDPASIAAFSRESVAQGLAAWSAEDVTGDARHRLYRATILERWELGPGDRASLGGLEEQPPEQVAEREEDEHHQRDRHGGERDERQIGGAFAPQNVAPLRPGGRRRSAIR